MASFLLSTVLAPPPLGDYTNALTISITHEQASLNVAPSANWFECIIVAGADTPAQGVGEVYDPQMHDILYLWDFGDASNATPTTPLNIPNIWKDTNTAYSKRVAHAFNDAGTYTVTCYAYEPATRRFGSTTVEVTIQDADTYFPGTRTIVYAPNGTSGLTIPSGANVQATWAGIISARNAISRPTTARILIAPGVVVPFSGTERITADAWANARIGALDPIGERPVLDGSALFDTEIFRDTDAHCVELVFYGLDWRGGWDSTIEKGSIAQPFNIRSGSHNGDQKAFMVHRCSFNGFRQLTPMNIEPLGKIFYSMFSDTKITNWQNFGIFAGYFQRPDVPQGYFAAVGCDISQHADALSGGDKNHIGNHHGPWRDYGSRHAFLSVCGMFSRNGWSASGSFEQRGVPLQQGAVRINTTGHRGCKAEIDRVAAENGFAIMEQASKNGDPPGNYVFDKYLVVAGGAEWAANLNSIGMGGVTARNILAIKLNIPSASTNTTQAGFTVTGEYSTPEGLATPVKVHNATYIDLRDNATFGGEVLFLSDRRVENASPRVPFTNESFNNNLLYRPNYTGFSNPTGATINIGTLLDGFTLRHKGPRWNYDPLVLELVSDVPNGGTLTIPYADLTDRLVDLNAVPVGPANATNQAYWLANEATDTRHEVYFDGGVNASLSQATWYRVAAGQLSVAFSPAGAVITNNTGVTWQAGREICVQLDRTSRLPAFETAFASVGQSLDFSIGRPVAVAASEAYDNFQEVERPSTGDLQGAI